jgi:hypothetical protein
MLFASGIIKTLQSILGLLFRLIQKIFWHGLMETLGPIANPCHLKLEFSLFGILVHEIYSGRGMNE